jgi:hypothetical protein
MGGAESEQQEEESEGGVEEEGVGENGVEGSARG